MSENMRACCSASRNQVVRQGSNDDCKENTSVQGLKGDKELSDMMLIPAATFLMGTDDKEGFPADGEGPVRNVTLSTFLIDVTAVTNKQFATFIKETNYVTDAERFGWSYVFHSFVSMETGEKVTQVATQTPWWWVVEGADWCHPEGPDSHVDERLDHPAIHISWHDADAYCRWAGKRLPTEAEWEYAARGGLIQKRYPWGDELKPGGEHRCNIWQGKFPDKNHASDGFAGTAPVRSYQPNGYGLYNMSGNVWEWCEDWFTKAYHLSSESVNPRGLVSGVARSMRGGSYLCHKSYCNRYRVAARSKNTPDSSAGNIGFRCVADYTG